MGKREGLLGIGVVTSEQSLDPVELRGTFISVVGAYVPVVEGVGQGVLGDDVEITAVEVRIPLVLLKALTEDHVGGDETPRVGATEDKAVLWQVCEHVMAVHPAEPMTALAALRQASDQGVDRRSNH